MKIFRLLAASLLVAVCAGFSSCGDDELEEHQTEVISEIMNAMALSIGGILIISQA